MELFYPNTGLSLHSLLLKGGGSGIWVDAFQLSIFSGIAVFIHAHDIRFFSGIAVFIHKLDIRAFLNITEKKARANATILINFE